MELIQPLYWISLSKHVDINEIASLWNEVIDQNDCKKALCHGTGSTQYHVPNSQAAQFLGFEIPNLLQVESYRVNIMAKLKFFFLL